MRYGFVIDQRRCIGCHACTVACKEENQVPLGTFRTWVKYVERGETVVDVVVAGLATISPRSTRRRAPS